MFAEVITGIALVNKSVDFIKNNISTARDIGQIAKQIDDLFEGKTQLDKKRSKRTGMSISEQFGVKSVATEIIDAKLAAEQLEEVGIMVDNRFGYGTWRGIIAERNKRIADAKEAAKVEAKEKAEKMQEITTIITVIGCMGGAAILLIGIVYILTR
tara:strand:- start:318 stop:785 length:468 start_codon:yes stop_codon:yes gene_type:complete